MAYTLEYFKKTIENTKPHLREISLRFVLAHAVCIGRRRNPETQRIMTLYFHTLSTSEFVVENGKIV